MKKESFDKKFNDAFDSVLKSMSKEELNALIEEISNLDTGGEPTIDEYFNQCSPTVNGFEYELRELLRKHGAEIEIEVSGGSNWGGGESYAIIANIQEEPYTIDFGASIRPD